MRDKHVIDYILINAADKYIKNKTQDVTSIIKLKKTHIDSMLDINIVHSKKTQIDKFIENPSTHTANLNSYTKKSELSTPSFAASSRPTTPLPTPRTPRPSSAPQSLSFESDCTILGKTLMLELGDMRSPEVNKVPPMCTFFLSNKRYCYHIMKNVRHESLKQLINYFYFNKNPPPSIPYAFNEINSFLGIDDIFDIKQITNVDELVLGPNPKKNLLFTIKSKIQLVVPTILSIHYVLVSYMNDGYTETIDYKTGYDTITIPNPNATHEKTILLNYQYMQFPPSIQKGTTTNPVTTRIGPPNVQKKQSISKRPPTLQNRKTSSGGNKTIRKYRKHNRNKTTRNYN